MADRVRTVDEMVAAFDAAAIRRLCGCRDCVLCWWSMPEKWKRDPAEKKRAIPLPWFSANTKDFDDE